MGTQKAYWRLALGRLVQLFLVDQRPSCCRAPRSCLASSATRVRVTEKWTLGTPTLGNAVAAVAIIGGLAVGNVWVGVLPVRMFLFSSLVIAIGTATTVCVAMNRRRAESREHLRRRDS